MRLFDEAIGDIGRFVNEKRDKGPFWQSEAETPVSWPRADHNNIVLKSDTGLELGGPDAESLSFLVWTNSPSLVSDHNITLVGADFGDISQPTHPFGKVVIVAGRDFSPENAHDRFRELDLLRLDLALKGYMVRGVSQELKEWSRISKEALNIGFSVETLGSALIDKYKELDYVTAAEVIFISSSAETINELRPTGERVKDTISAMRKMIEELSYDCANCDFQEICQEIDDLKMFKKL